MQNYNKNDVCTGREALNGSVMKTTVIAQSTRTLKEHFEKSHTNSTKFTP